MKYWYGKKISLLKDNEIFVFGSNVEGRHGKGAALFAKNKCGAIYGLGRGLQGQSYGLITKNLKPYTKEVINGRTIVYEKYGERSISIDMIVRNIRQLYKLAEKMFDYDFLIPYTKGSNLNGYTFDEMFGMFHHPKLTVPDNIIFHESWAKPEFNGMFK